ncbi:MAG: ABC transporter permease subunit [Anaerolineales bacterium]
MPTNSELTPVVSRGWSGGLRNMMSAELGRWFGTRTWWSQALIWVLVIDGLLLAIFSQEAGPELPEVTTMFVLFAGLFPPIAVIISAQDAIVGEKDKGTAAWVLSKPVSRTSFVLSKMIAYSLGILVSLVLIPSIGAFFEMTFLGSGGVELAPFALGVGMLWLYMCFYLLLTLMLGTFFSQRAPVIGIPLALAFGQQILFGVLPVMAKILPWTIVIPFGTMEHSIISAVMAGQAPPDMLPFWIACGGLVVFIAVSLWRFEREEL